MLDTAHQLSGKATGLKDSPSSMITEDLRLRGIGLVCFDMDQTLLDSASWYTNLEYLTCAAFGFTDRAAVEQLHRELQAQSNRAIMTGMHQLCLSGGGDQVSFDTFDAHFRDLLTKIKKGELPCDNLTRQIEGARLLVETVRNDGMKTIITTGSSLASTNLLLKSAGLSDLFETGELYCLEAFPNCESSTGFLAKKDPDYWASLRRNFPGLKLAGFEDNVEAATWMLNGGLDAVYVRPAASQLQQAAALAQQFPGRLTVVQCWKNLTGEK